MTTTTRRVLFGLELDAMRLPEVVDLAATTVTFEELT